MLLSVDPGLPGCGIAVWGEELVRAGFCKCPAGAPPKGPVRWAYLANAVLEQASEADFLIVELMRVYTQGKADPDDLLELQGVSAALCGAFAREHGPESVRGYLAREWKGQVPRDIMGARVEKWARERGWTDRIEVPSRKTWTNDVMHAIGLGRYHIERGSDVGLARGLPPPSGS